MQEQIPFNSEDFELHTQRRKHKEKESELKSSCSSTNENDIAQVESNNHANNVDIDVSRDQVAALKTAGSVSSVNSSSYQSSVRASSQETTTNVSVHSSSTILEDAIKADKVAQTVVARTISFVLRTKIRINYEAQILESIIGYINAFDPKVQLIPFGSSTYGFGGLNTNFNILANSGEIWNFKLF